MAHKKAGGTVKNKPSGRPKYLGIKIHDGQAAKPGSILVRQRGTKFNGSRRKAKIVNVVPSAVDLQARPS